MYHKWVYEACDFLRYREECMESKVYPVLKSARERALIDKQK